MTTINEAAERELARLAAAHYELPETDIPALMAFERHKNEQVKILGMPGLSAIPCFIAGWNAGEAARATLPPASGEAPIGTPEGMGLYTKGYAAGRKKGRQDVAQPSREVVVGGRRLIPDSECVQGKCGCRTTGCWDECSLKRNPVLYATQPAAPECQPCNGMGYTDGSGETCAPCGGTGTAPEMQASHRAVASSLSASADSAADARDAARWRYVRDTETLENYVWEALEGIGLAPDGVLDQAAYAASMDAVVDRAIAAIQAKEV